MEACCSFCRGPSLFPPLPSPQLPSPRSCQTSGSTWALRGVEFLPVSRLFTFFFPRTPSHIRKTHCFFYYTFYENKTFSRKMVAEKETLSLNKCPDKMPKRTKLLAQQPLPVHQPHSLVSEGFTVKAMMKNSVVSDLLALNALAPNQGTPDYRCWPAL